MLWNAGYGGQNGKHWRNHLVLQCNIQLKMSYCMYLQIKLNLFIIIVCNVTLLKNQWGICLPE